MKNLLPALLALPFLTGCLGLDQKFAEARMDWGNAISAQAGEQAAANAKLETVMMVSSAELAAGLKTAEEHSNAVAAAAKERSDTIGESLDALGDSVSDTWVDLKEGVATDFATLKATVSAGGKTAASVLGFGQIWDLVAAAGTAVVGANVARNRGLPGTTRINKPPIST